MKACVHVLVMCICMVIPFGSIAQTRLSDSLETAIDHNSLSEQEKPPLLNQLVEIYRINKKYKAAEARARQSAAIALQHNNYTDATKAYTLLVDIKINTQQFSTLKPVSDSALALAKQANNPVAMAYGYYSQVLLFKMLDNGEDVVRYCNQALKELEKVDDPYIAAKVYYRLYAVYSDWNNEARVNTYARKATESALRTKDYNLLSNCYMALSVAHEYNFNAAGDRQAPDSILFYLNRVEDLYRQYPGQVANFTYAIACINLANSYLKYYPETDGTARAKGIYYANTARAVLKDVANCEEVVGSSLGILSEYASRAGNETQAGNYLLEAYSVMKAQQPPYYYTMINIVQALSIFYAQKGDYQRALDFQKEVTAKLQIQQVHPDFFYLISERAQRKLTLLDLKLCAYLYLKMDTRQIAQLMHIETKSVRMSRYRIKQKLGLEKEDDLNSFLQGLGG